MAHYNMRFLDPWRIGGWNIDQVIGILFQPAASCSGEGHGNHTLYFSLPECPDDNLGVSRGGDANKQIALTAFSLN